MRAKQVLAPVVTVTFMSAAFWWLPSPTKSTASQQEVAHYKETKRTPKAGCYQRRMMHEHSQNNEPGPSVTK
jgi:hypothetical protein